ncbi:endonuclease domain-containing protein [Methylobacterium fujisawaense]
MPWSPKQTREYHKRYYQENFEEMNARARERYLANIEKYREAKNASARRLYAKLTPEEKTKRAEKHKAKRIKRQYNLTQDDWQILFNMQDQKCAVCRADDPGVTGWATDHCHTTLKVRGILCPACNKALGLVKDDPTILTAMITYLAKDKS